MLDSVGICRSQKIGSAGPRSLEIRVVHDHIKRASHTCNGTEFGRSRSNRRRYGFNSKFTMRMEVFFE